jgi:uroporphyrin-III C-methyltransferase/precorrin-2 dehydrogenase/sirohydrochlorin ferrochelatase
MASRLCRPLKHHDHVQTLCFATGHSRHGGLPDDVDWAHVADRRTTTVFYMGGQTACLIADKVIEQGLPRQTPAVIISDISRSTERN